MSKYIIEIAKEYEEYFRGVLICGIADGKFAVDVIAREDLEELNSDYINEHFGELQDEAYQRGHDDGYEAGCATAFKPVSDAEYQRGFEDGKKSIEKGCDGCKYEWYGDTEDPCWHCRRCYKDKYEPTLHSDRIEVGDVVERYIDGKLDSKGIYLQEDGGYWRCLFYTGAIFMTFAYPKGQFKKTGKHYDIQSILEAMKS